MPDGDGPPRRVKVDTRHRADTRCEHRVPVEDLVALSELARLRGCHSSWGGSEPEGTWLVSELAVRRVAELPSSSESAMGLRLL